MKLIFVGLGLLSIFATAWAIECPTQDENSPAVYYPHETECGKFYECTNGAAELLDCPPGLYWDSHLNVCNRNVDCGNLSTSTAPPPTTTVTTTDTSDAE